MADLFQNPYKVSPPQQYRLPTEFNTQMEDQFRREQTMLKTEADRRSEEFSSSQELWKAGKLKDQDFLTGIANLSNQAYSEDERKAFNTMYEVTSQEILKNKLAVEFDKIQAQAIDNKMNAKQVFNAITQLGVQASSAGLEKLAASYFLQASLLQNQIAQDKGKFSEKKGSGSKNAKDSILNKLNNL